MATNNSACPAPMQATSNGVFQGDNPVHFALPLVILQICLVFVITRLLAFLLRPLRQPRVIAEIIVIRFLSHLESFWFIVMFAILILITERICLHLCQGGILLGPSALGRNKSYLNAVFPSRSLTVLDTLANLGLLFFLFLVGLELDLKSLRGTRKKALSIALAGISLPFVLGIGTSFVLRATISQGVHKPPFLIFMGVALSITAFPVLARILAELRLLTTDVGRLALSAAAINDVAAWVLLALAIALSEVGRSPLVSIWVLLCGCGFVLCCIIIIPPFFSWMARRCPEGEPVDEKYVCATLVAVLAAGFTTDAIGIHALFGAFVFGVLVPKEGTFSVALVEKVEDLVSGIFLPLYFVSSGLKTNVATIHGLQSWGMLVLVITTACFGKIIGTVTVALLCRAPFQEALALGFLMNTKGLVELIVLNIGKDRKVLNDETFAIMVLMAIFTTFMTTPLVMAVYKPAKRMAKAEHKYRTVERKDPNTQLRLLVCFHSTRNIPSMLNLIEASRGAGKREGLCVYVLHLMELSERSSAILMVHKARNNGLPFWNKVRNSNANQIEVAFEAFEQLSRVSIRSMTAISPMSDIHEDICASADNKRAAMIILPFHKHQRIDGAFESTRNEFRLINKRVLENAPCSVGILVDRCLGGNTHVSASNVSSTVTVLFFGGRDDNEALAYGLRMAEHPGISVTVVHFLASLENVGEIVNVDRNDDMASNTKSVAGNNVVSEVKEKIRKNMSIQYEERGVRNTGEIIEGIREYRRCNLFLVGRIAEGQVAMALSNFQWECPELGPVCNLLIAPEFSTTASVLVVQHYNGQTSVISPSHSTKIEVSPHGEDSETNS